MSRRVHAAASIVALAFCCASCSRAVSPQQTETWRLDIARLEAEQDSLRNRAATILANDPRYRSIPEGDVVIAVPTAFVRGVLERVFEDVAKSVTLRLTGLKARVAKTVKKVVTVGEFVVEVDSIDVLGKLRPSPPTMNFGGNKIGLTLPVDVSEGSGGAKIHFVWDGKNVAGMTCGDLDITRVVTGEVVPASYSVSGALDLAIRDRRLVGVPTFPETRLLIRVRPTQAAWDTVQAILDEKRGVCGWVLDKVDVPGILKRVVEEKGFNVKLPLQKIKPFVVPSGVQDSVRIGERMLAVDAQTTTFRVDPQTIWYGARVKLKGVHETAAATPTP
jgi:hypothetical protein